MVNIRQRARLLQHSYLALELEYFLVLLNQLVFQVLLVDVEVEED